MKSGVVTFTLGSRPSIKCFSGVEFLPEPSLTTQKRSRKTQATRRGTKRAADGEPAASSSSEHTAVEKSRPTPRQPPGPPPPAARIPAPPAPPARDASVGSVGPEGSQEVVAASAIDAAIDEADAGAAAAARRDASGFASLTAADLEVARQFELDEQALAALALLGDRCQDRKSRLLGKLLLKRDQVREPSKFITRRVWNKLRNM